MALVLPTGNILDTCWIITRQRLTPTKTFARQRLNFSYPALQDRWGIEMEGHHAVCLGAVFYLVQTKVVAGKQMVNRLVFTSDSEIPAL